MSETPKMPPYQTLGHQLLRLRQSRQESVAEVSGAVEIEPGALERFEQGLELPSEDILLLLISHFNIRDDEAVKLWEMAGYDHEDQAGNSQPQQGKQPVLMVLGLDSRIVYSNGIHVSADPSGVVMSFTQYADPTQQATAVSRVGMSRDQAEKVLETLQQALLRDKYAGGPKSLPAPQAQQPKTVNRSRKKSQTDK